MTHTVKTLVHPVTNHHPQPNPEDHNIDIHKLSKDKQLNDLLAALSTRGGPGDELWSGAEEGFRDLIDDHRPHGKQSPIPDVVSKVGVMTLGNRKFVGGAARNSS